MLALNTNRALADTQPQEWGSIAIRNTQSESSTSLYFPELGANIPRIGIFGTNKTSHNFNYGISFKQILTPNKSERTIFFADLRLGEETYKNFDLAEKKFTFLELGFFIGTNLAWPRWKYSTVASLGVTDRSNYISNASIKNSDLNISRRAFSPAWQVWFIF
jgi:hypothetical protein